MKVSILTVCLNNEETIELTLNSLLAQGYNDIEHIVKDGDSKDHTLEIINSLSSKSIVESSEDDGLYFALNHAISMATGDVIGILHADDFFASGDVVSKVVEFFEKDQCDAVYGDLIYVDRADPTKVKRQWSSGVYSDGDFLKGWMPPHPAFFVKREIIEKYGTYNTNFKTASDYEWMLRLIHKHKIKISYLPKILVSMRRGGQSNRSLFNRILANKEDRLAWKVNDLKPKWFTLWLKPLKKVRQFY